VLKLPSMRRPIYRLLTAGTGAFDRKVTGGYIHMLKLHHLETTRSRAFDRAAYRSSPSSRMGGGQARSSAAAFRRNGSGALERTAPGYTLPGNADVKWTDVAAGYKVW